jgi:hypothetical protein
MKHVTLNLDRRTKILEAITGGFALAWLMASLLSWIIRTTSLSDIGSSFPTSTFILLVFLAIFSVFALTVSKALKEGLYGSYTLFSFNIFWIIFIVISNVLGLQQVTSFFFNGGVLCLIQIMISYTTTIFTLAETNVLNLNMFTGLIFAITPFLASLIFLIGTYLTKETVGQIKIDTNQILWIISVLIAMTMAYIAYVLHGRQKTEKSLSYRKAPVSSTFPAN